MLSTPAEIGFVGFVARRALSLGVFLAMLCLFFAISAGAAQACSPERLSESHVTAAEFTIKPSNATTVRSSAELRSSTAYTSFKVIGVCCGSLVPGSNCPSFSCAMCFVGLPTVLSSVSPPEVASSCDVADDIGLIFSEPRADFHPPRDFA